MSHLVGGRPNNLQCRSMRLLLDDMLDANQFLVDKSYTRYWDAFSFSSKPNFHISNEHLHISIPIPHIDTDARAVYVTSLGESESVVTIHKKKKNIINILDMRMLGLLKL